LRPDFIFAWIDVLACTGTCLSTTIRTKARAEELERKIERTDELTTKKGDEDDVSDAIAWARE
jgi:sulfite reductase beta subunit-like hemoprotein